MQAQQWKQKQAKSRPSRDQARLKAEAAAEAASEAGADLAEAGAVAGASSQPTANLADKWPVAK